jgi:hypothetical protein
MDLIKGMLERRAAMGQMQQHPLVKYEPRKEPERKKTKAQKAKEIPPGTKAMRKFIQEEKPNNKIVREHIEALVHNYSSDTESDSD